MKWYALADCNNFYASCERVFQPQLATKPIVVLSNNDGCVIARSEEAKGLGIEMGVPFFQLKKRIGGEQVHVFSSNYALYGDMSSRVMNLLSQYAADIEIYSIDEAFLLFDFYKMDAHAASIYAEKIRQKVLQATGLPISIGIGPSKTLAKLASHIAKRIEKKGVYAIRANNPLLAQIPIKKVWGIGRAYQERLERVGVKTVQQLTEVSEQWMKKEFGVVGLRLLKELKGTACLPLEEPIREKKQVMVSRSFPKDIYELEELCEAFSFYATRLGEKLRQYQQTTAFIQVFLMVNRHKKQGTYPNYFSQNVCLPVATANSNELIHWTNRIVRYLYRKGINYKKGGILASHLVAANTRQLPLFSDTEKMLRYEQVHQTMDALNKKMGANTVYFSSCGKEAKFKHRQDHLSQAYTTNWKELLVVK